MTFAEAIANLGLSPSDNENRCIAAEILNMPEMLAIKATLVELFVDEFHDRDQIIGSMKAWGYTDALCDWVLS